MGAAAVFWRAALTQGGFFGIFIGAYFYTQHGRAWGAVTSALLAMLLMGMLNGWWAVRDRRRVSRELGGLFQRRTAAELRRGLREPESADPALRAGLRSMLRRHLGEDGPPLWPAPLIAGLAVVGTSIAGILVSPVWFLPGLASAVLWGDAVFRRGRLRLALRRLEQVDARSV